MCLCDLYCTSQLLSMKKADACGCPIIIANDPDADRLAVAEKLPRYTPGYTTLHWGGSALLSLFNFFFKDYQTFSSSLCCLTCSGVSCKFKAMLPGLSYANKNVNAFLPFWKGCTGSLLRSVSITKLPHLLSGILRVPSLHTFLCFFLPTNPLKLFGPAAENSSSPPN